MTVPNEARDSKGRRAEMEGKEDERLGDPVDSGVSSDGLVRGAEGREEEGRERRSAAVVLLRSRS